MAVIINQQPANEPLQIGAPVFYRVFVFEDINNTPPKLQVQVYIEGNEYEGPKNFGHKSVDTDAFPGFGLYYFEITVNSELQKYLADGKAYRTLGDYAGQTMDKMSAEFYVKFTDWLDDGTGFLALQGTSTDSATRYVVNAYIPGRDDQSLSSFQISTGNGFGVFRKRFSEPTYDIDQSDFLYYWADGVSFLIVSTFNAAGSLLSNGILLTTAASEVQSVGIGPANINAISSNNAWNVGGVVINNDVSRVGVIMGSGGTGSREIYYKVGDCGSYLNLHFLNQYGAVEIMQVNGSYSDEYRTESSLFKPNIPLSTLGMTDLEIQLLGNVERFGITGFREITCSITDIPEADMEFYRNFQRCKVVMLEEDDVYRPFVVSDTKMKLYDSDERLYIINFTIVGAREDQSHI